MGRRKLTQQEVDNYLFSRGFKMVGTYTKGRDKHTFECINGHQWSSRFDHIKGGSGCPHCYGNAKISQKSVNEYLAKRRFRILEEYKGMDYKHIFECENKHTWSTTYHNIKNGGSGCPHCHNLGLTETNLYVMFAPSIGTKIGVSHQPERRMREIMRSGNITSMEVLRVFEIKDYNKSREIESLCHKHFSKYNCGYKDFDGCTEFFNIEPELAVEFIENALAFYLKF